MYVIIDTARKYLVNFIQNKDGSTSDTEVSCRFGDKNVAKEIATSKKIYHVQIDKDTTRECYVARIEMVNRMVAITFKFVEHDQARSATAQ